MDKSLAAFVARFEDVFMIVPAFTNLSLHKATAPAYL